MTPTVATQTEDLEALFDRIAAERDAAPACAPGTPRAAAPAPDAAREAPAVFERIGALTRTLHDALRELGHDKTVEAAVQTLPDARERLAYIAALTGTAAERALAAVDQGKAALEANQVCADALATDWARLHAGALDVEAFKALAGRTQAYFDAQAAHRGRVNDCLLEVMMAQDFHDLTGQVIQRLVKLAQTLEDQLVKLLLEATPPARRPAGNDAWLGGPSVGGARADVLGSQAQVDQLLESLGF